MSAMREVLDEIVRVNSRLAREFIEASEGLYSISDIHLETHISSKLGQRVADAVVVTNVTTFQVK